MQDTNELARAQAVRDTVRKGYAGVATASSQGASCCGPTCCGGQVDSASQLAAAVGYTNEELAGLPEGANMGLSCGNPTALAALSAGETVLDLGSGGGFDVFIAGRKVGASGRVIGVDMTPEMIAKARRNQAAYTARTGLANVEFRLGEIEHLPLADASVDVVISNCVINLSPDKPSVYREIARVLRPGGRIAVSDIVLKKPLPEAIRHDAEALVGCVAGALLLDELRAIISANGLADAAFVEKPGYVQAMEESKDHIAKRVYELIPAGEKLADHIASMDISARKPS
ncbi:MAG: arsenite methyltransferase [Candidatus Sumerlaeia bacterium]|nr:arsenite methyltransferase [Candidatus Sumerlaeia bacterium]